MSNYRNRNPQRKTDQPPRVRHGIKLSTREGEPEPGNWIAHGWLDLIRKKLSHETMQTGLEYAQSGQTIELHCHPGRVDALIQGMAKQPARTTIRLPILSQAQWGQLIHDMTGEAVYTVRLMSSEVPESLEGLFDKHDLTVWPDDPDEVRIEGPDRAADRDRNAATMMYLLVERLTSDPTLVFLLRGMPAERVLDQLRQVRTIRTHGEATAHPQTTITRQTPAPLESSIETYWHLGSSLKEFENTPPPEHAPHALLRRLGPPPLEGRFPMVGLLASIYDEISRCAQQIDEGTSTSSVSHDE